MNVIQNFNPNWASPPGNTIDALIKEKNIPYNLLAQNLDIKTEVLKDLIYGNKPITTVLAEKLSVHLGASPNFWLNREKIFRCAVKELKVFEEKKWLNQLPTSEMVRLGWIAPDFSAESLLKYFNVANVWSWKAKYSRLFSTTAFRASPSFDANFMAVCSWLREGEIQAQKISCAPLNISLFQEKLIEIRKLTRKKNPKDFINILKKTCAECGIALAFVRTPKGCTASGATYSISKDKSIIILSFRYLKDDQFWFTFFHEAGHVILHGKNIFVEELNHEGLDSDQEKEANTFSSNILLSESAKQSLFAIPKTKEGILRFALNNGISAGIVIGQMQFHGIIGFNQLNWYKRTYNWEDISKFI